VSSDRYTDAAIWSWSQKTGVLCHWHTRWSRFEDYHVYIVEGRWGLRMIAIVNGPRCPAFSIPPEELPGLKHSLDRLHKSKSIFNATALVCQEWIIEQEKR